MPITDATADQVAQETGKYFDKPLQIASALLDGSAFAFKFPAGVTAFVRSADKTYKIVLALSGSGAANKKAIVDSFDWMFSYTDAEILIGIIAADNDACIAMIPQTWGYTVEDLPDRKIYRLTKSRWFGERK